MVNPNLRSATMRNKLFFSIVLLLLVLGAVLRLYKVDQFPPQLNRDEAALALNALYIHQSGVDEWGVKYPLQFKSFGDYKLPGYIYLLSALFQFNSNDFIVRLPSVVAGSVIPLLVMVLATRFIEYKKNKVVLIFILLSLTLSPFSFFYSRMAWEANLALSLMIGALILLFKKESSILNDSVAVVLYTLAVLTYNSPLLLLPFFILILPFVRGVKNYKSWIAPVVSLSIVCIFFLIVFSQNNAQKSGILFFKDPTIISQYPAYRAGFPSFLKTLLGNKLVYFITIGTAHYRDTFLPYFLVTHGGQHPWHSILGRGHLYWTTYILFVIGFFSQIWLIHKQFSHKKAHKKLEEIIQQSIPLFLLLVSPLPAIITTDAPHATRSLFTFIMIVIFSGFGLQSILALLTKYSKKISTTFLFLLTLLLCIEASQYLYQYFYVWPPTFTKELRIGFKPKLLEATQQFPNGSIGVIDQGWYMYVLAAWYIQTPSTTFLSTVERTGPDTVGLYTVTHVGQFYFFEHENTKQIKLDTIIRTE